MNWKTISEYRTELMGIFALWIMFYHNKMQISSSNPLWVLSKQGNVGVDAFLFLSGIGLYYSFSKKQDLLEFYKKRLIRLLVPYLCLATPFYLWRASVESGKTSFVEYITQTAFVKSGSITTWFVPCIFMCSVIFPAIYYIQNKSLLLGEGKKNRNTITLIITAVYFGLLLFVQNSFPTFYSNTEIALTRLIIFILGCHCGKYVEDSKALPNGISLAGFLFIIIYTFSLRKMVKLPAFWIRMSYVPLSLAWIFFISGVLNNVQKRFNVARFRILLFAGKRSLEIYLIHIMLRWVYLEIWGMPKIEKTGTVDYVIVMVITVLLAAFLQPLFAKFEQKLLSEGS